MMHPHTSLCKCTHLVVSDAYCASSFTVRRHCVLTVTVNVMQHADCDTGVTGLVLRRSFHVVW